MNRNGNHAQNFMLNQGLAPLRSLRRGLSIIEVMLAILIVGVTVTTLLGLQAILQRGIFTSHALVDRIGYIKTFFVEADRDKLYEQEKSQKKTIETPALSMTYTVAKPVGIGLKSYQQIEIERVVAEYPTVFGTRTETFARLRFLLRPEKKK